MGHFLVSLFSFPSGKGGDLIFRVRNRKPMFFLTSRGARSEFRRNKVLLYLSGRRFNILNSFSRGFMLLRFLRYTLLMISLCCTLLSAQEGEFHAGISKDSILKAAHLIIDSSACCVLITVDEEGKPRAREMSAFPPDEDFIIWFGTSPKSRKVAQIRSNPNVNVYYYDPKGLSYVTISGKGRIINDPEKKEKYWIDWWKSMYPDKEKDYILIEISPEELEVFSVKYNLLWQTDAFTPHRVNLIKDDE
jgi:general stress protein 26